MEFKHHLNVCAAAEKTIVIVMWNQIGAKQKPWEPDSGKAPIYLKQSSMTKNIHMKYLQESRGHLSAVTGGKTRLRNIVPAQVVWKYSIHKQYFVEVLRGSMALEAPLSWHCHHKLWLYAENVERRFVGPTYK